MKKFILLLSIIMLPMTMLNAQELTPFGDNLLANGDFENELTSWEITGNTQAESATSPDGSTGYCFNQLETASAFWSGIRQIVSVQEGTNYLLGGQLEASNSVEAHMKVIWSRSDDPEDYASEVGSPLYINADSIAGWQYLEGAMTAPQGANFAFILIWHGVETNVQPADSRLCLDNVYFTTDITGFNVLSLPDRSQAEIGQRIMISVENRNTNMVNGGGLNGMQFNCNLAPQGILTGQDITAGTAFPENPSIINNGFDESGTSFEYWVALTGDTPLVTEDGTVFTVDVVATETGIAELLCNVVILDGTEAEVSDINFVTAEIEVVPPSEGTETVSGSVQLSVTDQTDTITVQVLDEGDNIILEWVPQEDGTFVQSVPAGEYTIRATSPGYLTAEGPLNIVPGQPVVLQPIELLAGDIDQDLIINVADVTSFGLCTTDSEEPPLECDFNRDGQAGLTDLGFLSRNIQSPRLEGPIIWDSE